MDAPTGGEYTRVVFRLAHNCSISRLSRAFPEATFLSWSAHRRDIVNVITKGRDEEAIKTAFASEMPYADLITYEGGLLGIFKPPWSKTDSISWQLEANHALWLQPLRCVAGWEEFDVISLDNAALERYLQSLLKAFTLKIISRTHVAGKEFSRSFFQPINPVLNTMTGKQWEALQGALSAGYYEQPRKATTRAVAKNLGLSRSAFEERLRNAENALIKGVVGATGAPTRARARL